MSSPTGGRRQSMPGGTVGNGRRSGSYEQMQTVLDSQKAANEATRQAMQQITVTMNGMLNSMDSLIGGPTLGPGYGQGPHGGRPTMSGNQTRRPSIGDYSTQPYSPYGTVGGGRGLNGVRQNIARGLNGRYGVPSGNRFEEVRDANGVLQRHNEYDPNGNLVEEHGPGWAGTPEGSSALRGAARRQVASRALQGLSEGGSVGAARAIPYVGAAVLGAEAVKEGLTIVGDQRAKNSQYQSIYGGSNFSQFGQRAQGFGFGVSNLFGGGLTWGDSQKAFQGVSALGYKGDQRGQDLSFITQNYMKMGVSVSDSLKLITTAAGDLNESLTGLQTGLKSSRDAAIAAGMSGNVGTQLYQNNYSQLAGKFAGPGTAAVAGVVSQAQASLGRVGSNVSLTNMLTNKSSLYQLAAGAGVDYTTLVGAIQSGDMKTVGKALDHQLGSVAAPYSSPTLSNYITSQVRDIAGGSPTAGLAASRKNLNQDSLAQIASNILDSKGHQGLNVDSLVASYTARGITQKDGSQLTPEQAVMQYVATTQGVENFQKTAPLAEVYKPHEKAGHVIVGAGKATHSEIDYSHKGVNPVIDHALSNSLTKGKQVQVTVNGEHRIVDIATAAKYYPDQIAKGTAIVMGSGGKSVRQLLGGEHQTSVIVDKNKVLDRHVSKINEGNIDTTHLSGIGKAGTKDDNLDDRKGMSVAAYNKKKKKETEDAANDPKKNGKVIISPSEELKKLLNFTPSGNAAIAYQAASVGAVPAPG